MSIQGTVAHSDKRMLSDHGVYVVLIDGSFPCNDPFILEITFTDA